MMELIKVVGRTATEPRPTSGMALRGWGSSLYTLQFLSHDVFHSQHTN